MSPARSGLTDSQKICFTVAGLALVSAGIGHCVNQYVPGWMQVRGMVMVAVLYGVFGLWRESTDATSGEPSFSEEVYQAESAAGRERLRRTIRREVIGPVRRPQHVSLQPSLQETSAEELGAARARPDCEPWQQIVDA